MIAGYWFLAAKAGSVDRKLLLYGEDWACWVVSLRDTKPSVKNSALSFSLKRKLAPTLARLVAGVRFTYGELSKRQVPKLAS